MREKFNAIVGSKGFNGRVELVLNHSIKMLDMAIGLAFEFH